MTFAAVKIRGSIKSSPSIRDTLKSLNLENKYDVVFLDESDANLGMLRKAESYIAYGTVEDSFIEDHGFETGKKYAMSPPSGGLDGTKTHYQEGGSNGKNPEIQSIIGDMV